MCVQTQGSRSSEKGGSQELVGSGSSELTHGALTVCRHRANLSYPLCCRHYHSPASQRHWEGKMFVSHTAWEGQSQGVRPGSQVAESLLEPPLPSCLGRMGLQRPEAGVHRGIRRQGCMLGELGWCRA